MSEQKTMLPELDGYDWRAERMEAIAVEVLGYAEGQGP